MLNANAREMKKVETTTMKLIQSYKKIALFVFRDRVAFSLVLSFEAFLIGMAAFDSTWDHIATAAFWIPSCILG